MGKQEQTGEQGLAGGKEQSLEQIFQELESIIANMQQRDVSLEDSFQLYEQGIQKLKQCNEKIDYVEKQMLLLNGQGELEPLDAE